jgi:NitT/TauT family transport system substrate-binding protein
VPTTVVLIGDYSNGNDALLVRNGLQLKDLPGKKMLLVQKTVSEYLFDRAMTLNGMRDHIKRVRMINTSDADLAGAFIGDTSVSAAVTWKPLVSQIQKQKGVNSLFNSSQIPGEILDLTVVRNDVLARPDGAGGRFAKALTGAVVRGAGADGGDWTGGRQGAHRHRRGAAGHAGVVQGTAQYHQDVLHAQERDRLRRVAGHEAEDGARAPVRVRSRPAGEQHEVGRRRGHQVSGWHRAGKPDRVRLTFDHSYMGLAAQGKL